MQIIIINNKTNFLKKTDTCEISSYNYIKTFPHLISFGCSGSVTLIPNTPFNLYLYGIDLLTSHDLPQKNLPIVILQYYSKLI